MIEMSISNTVYVVTPHKRGWAVNNGADTVSFHNDHAEATARARQLSHEAVDDGEAASVIDIECCEGEPTPPKPL
jgi:hypothetical protein